MKAVFKPNQGFTLIEVLIALVITSLGLLGLLALQTTGLRSNHMSTMRTQATLMAYEMADRINANSDGASTSSNYTIAHGSSPSGSAPDCVASICSDTDMSTYDLWQWKNTLDDNLTSGDGEITFADPDYTVTVRWDENRDGSTGTTCPPVADTDLNCFALQVSI